MEPDNQGGFPRAAGPATSLFAFPKPSKAIEIVNPQSKKALDLRAVKHLEVPKPSRRSSHAPTPHQPPVPRKDPDNEAARKVARQAETYIRKSHQKTSGSFLRPNTKHLAEKAVLSLREGSGLTDEEARQVFNVYARPFLPRLLRDINTFRPIRVHETERSLDIDFESYVNESPLGRLIPRAAGYQVAPLPVALPMSGAAAAHDYEYRFSLYLRGQPRTCICSTDH